MSCVYILFICLSSSSLTYQDYVNHSCFLWRFCEWLFSHSSSYLVHESHQESLVRKRETTIDDDPSLSGFFPVLDVCLTLFPVVYFLILFSLNENTNTHRSTWIPISWMPQNDRNSMIPSQRLVRTSREPRFYPCDEKEYRKCSVLRIYSVAEQEKTPKNYPRNASCRSIDFVFFFPLYSWMNLFLGNLELWSRR